MYLVTGRGNSGCSPFILFCWQSRFSSCPAMRYLLPLGLNSCPPYYSISKTLRALSIIPDSRSVIEDETRRNTFWLAYATERLYSSGNGWAMSLDDQDVTQLLPVRRDQFEKGVRICIIHKSSVLNLLRLGTCIGQTETVGALSRHTHQPSSWDNRFFRAIYQSLNGILKVSHIF